MEGDTNVNEITNLITNKENIRNDVAEITGIIKNLLNDKYIVKMNELVSKHQEKTINNPPKEVMLMQAIKPFMQKEAQLNIDKMIQMMNMMSAARSLQQELQQARMYNRSENSSYMISKNRSSNE